MPAHSTPVTAVAASSKGDDVVVSADEQGEVRLWELPSFTPKGSASDGKDRGILETAEHDDPCTAVDLLGSRARGVLSCGLPNPSLGSCSRVVGFVLKV